MLGYLGLSAADLITIIQVGISGVAFLFVAMSFILLRKEQDRDGEPRDKVLKSIKQFTYFTLVFAILVAVISIYEKQTGATGACKEELERSRVLIQSENHTVSSVRRLFSKMLLTCLDD